MRDKDEDKATGARKKHRNDGTELGETVAVGAAVLDCARDTAQEDEAEWEGEDGEHDEAEQAAHVCLAGDHSDRLELMKDLRRFKLFSRFQGKQNG